MSGKRRQKILQLLAAHTDGPLSASAIASACGVSRQVIVGDIAILRAAGEDISATPRGYILQANMPATGLIKTIACRHTLEMIEDEFHIVVDNGGGILDVIIEHPVYGQLSGQLQVFSRYDAGQFMQALSENSASPLCQLTHGIHLHTITCPDEQAYNRILQGLREKGILFSRRDD